MRKFLALFAFLALVAVTGVYAQEQISEIQGVVTDEESTPLPGVSIEAVSPNLVGKASSMSDASGRYRLRGLVTGTYKLTFTLQGFATKIQENVFLRVGQVMVLNMSMKQAALEETVTVTAGSPIIDVRRSASATNITRDMFSRLPMGRNFSSLVTLAPSVNNEPWLAGVSVDGASGAENMYFVDGMDITGLYTGNNSLNIRLEHLEEVQVKTSGYEAEFGGSMGGVINVITRSGGNEFHGDATFYLTGSALNGKPRESLRISPVDNTVAEYITYDEKASPGVWNQYEFGLNLGGFIMKDRLWFYGGFLPTYLNYKRSVVFLQDNMEHTVNATRFWPRAQAKLTAQPLSNLRLSVSWANDLYRWKGNLPPADGSGNADLDYEAFGNTTPDMTFSGRADYIASPNLFFSLSGGYYYTNINAQQLVKPEGPRYYFLRSNVGMAGIPTDFQRARYWYNRGDTDSYATNKNIQTRTSASFDTTLYLDLAGEHAWKLGVQFAHIFQDVDDTYLNDYVRLYWGQGYAHPDGNIYRGTYGYYEVRGRAEQPYGTFARVTSDRYALFLQDSWTIGKKLTLNFGVRAEKEDIPAFYTKDALEAEGIPGNFKPISFDFVDKLSPRFGFSYDVFGDSSFKIFGSFGIFYDVMKLEMAEGSFGGFKWISHYYTLDTYEFTSIGDPNYPGTYLGWLDWRLPSFDTVQPDLEPMNQTEYTIGAEKLLAPDLSFRARGVYKVLNNTIEDIGVLTPQGEQYYIGNPGSDWINANTGEFWPCPTAKRKYWALDLSLEKRYSHNWMGGFSYTLSKLWGNYSGLASSDEFGRNSPNVERFFDLWFIQYQQNGDEAVGLLATDRTHQFKLWGSYTFDFGLIVGAKGFLYSGTPMSTEFYFMGVQGFFPVGRGDLGRSDWLPMFDIYAVYDLKIGGKFTLQFNLNVDNVFNLKTAQRIYGLYNQQNIYIDDADVMAGFDYLQLAADNDLLLDPRYKMKSNFTDSWSARLGVKFIF